MKTRNETDAVPAPTNDHRAIADEFAVDAAEVALIASLIGPSASVKAVDGGTVTSRMLFAPSK